MLDPHKAYIQQHGPIEGRTNTGSEMHLSTADKYTVTVYSSNLAQATCHTVTTITPRPSGQPT